MFRAGRATHARYALPKEKVLETRVEGSRLLPTVPEPDRTPQVSKYTITRADIDRTPGALEDVARVVQQVPGVAADPDLLASFYVRGGGPEEIVFYLDGVPLTNPYHLGGFASIFNPMLIESADFYAAGIPAQYEPALSGALRGALRHRRDEEGVGAGRPVDADGQAARRHSPRRRGPLGHRLGAAQLLRGLLRRAARGWAFWARTWWRPTSPS